jgi:ribosome-associated protein
VSEDPLIPQIETIVRAADKRKAEAIMALRLTKITTATEFMVIMVGNSRPQNAAIAAAIEEDMILQHNRTASHQGTANSGWILLDYGTCYT